MSYQPAKYDDPVLEEMDRLFGRDRALARVAKTPTKPARSDRVTG